MKYLIVGASGMVGHLIGVYLEEAGHDVVGYSRRTSPLSHHVQGDLYDLDLLEETIVEGRFDAVVNAAGLLVKDCEEHPDRAAFINGFIPHYLAKTVDESKTKVIQLSTDCIFRGNTGPYAEDSTPDGIEFYSLTKHTGEITYGRHLTLRNSVVGPDISEDGIGLLNWFMKQSGAIDGWDCAIWTGLTTLELAKVIEYAVEHDASGLVNMVPCAYLRADGNGACAVGS